MNIKGIKIIMAGLCALASIIGLVYGLQTDDISREGCFGLFILSCGFGTAVGGDF